MNNTNKIITAFAIGAVAGVVAGILFAPDKGSETRRKMNEQGKKVADAIKNKYHEAKNKCEKIREEMEDIREEYV